ncbi:MAG: hypothetical protein K8R69_10370 [Deltaproteobacteria bacterium]|nr:hypothetical protein [Deltaproteobacteria bacterium]
MKTKIVAFHFLAMTALPAMALACPGGNNQGPPPEASSACSGASENQACSFSSPHGSISGTCQNIQGQIACVPAGGPPPNGQGGGQGGPPSTQGGQVPQGA